MSGFAQTPKKTALGSLDLNPKLQPVTVTPLTPLSTSGACLHPARTTASKEARGLRGQRHEPLKESLWEPLW